jgi:hypothetical protein
MTQGVTVFVAFGIGAMVLLGLSAGFDIGAVVILALITACGALAIAVARRSEKRSVGPRSCPECGGLVSPNAPYCKHCNHVF